MQTNTLDSGKKNLNTAMLILQCIGILAVVFGHAGVPVDNVTTTAFTYYSWHMPFFIFISGYFFNRTRPTLQYIWHTVKTHLIPAWLVNLVCCVFSFVIKTYQIADYGVDITLDNLFIKPFTTGYSSGLTVSLWFVFALVVVQIVSCLMDRIARGKADLIYLALTLALALFCAHKVFYDNDGTRDEFLNFLLRQGYLLFYFWLGACYRRYGEQYLQKFLNFKTSLVLFLVQGLFVVLTGWKVDTNVRDMTFITITVPDGFWVGVVAPIIATLFFLGLAYSMAPHLQDSKLLATVGRNTRYVVYYHQLLLVLFAYLFAVLDKLSIYTLEGFSLKHMKHFTSVYYSGGNKAMTTIIAVIALILPIVVGRFVDKQKWYIRLIAYLALAGLVIGYLIWVGTVLAAA